MAGAITCDTAADRHVHMHNSLSWCVHAQAIGAQFCTAIGALLGTVIGLTTVHITGTQTLLGFTAGGFIYVSCVAVLPEVLSSQSTVLASLAEAFALCCGVGLMVAVAFSEEAGGSHDHHHHQHDGHQHAH